jgi:hypothetical protein
MASHKNQPNTTIKRKWVGHWHQINNHKVAQNNALEFSNHHTTRSKTASPGSNPAAQAARKNYTQNH